MILPKNNTVMSIITETSPQAKIEINANHSHVKHILIAVAVYFHFEMPRKIILIPLLLVSAIQNVGMYGF